MPKKKNYKLAQQEKKKLNEMGAIDISEEAEATKVGEETAAAAGVRLELRTLCHGRRILLCLP